QPFDPAEGARWLPVDLYTGGAEHAVMHLLYTRFFHKAMRDLGLFDTLRAEFPERNWSEPFPRLFNQGIISAFSHRDPEGRYLPYSQVEYEGDSPVHRETREPLTVADEKMSKSKLNVISPDEYSSRFGADVVRLFLMFIGPWEQGGPWNPRGVEGIVRFLNRVWSMVSEPSGSGTDPEAIRELQRAVHQAIRKVTRDIERFSFNTVVSALMELTNALQRLRAGAGGSAEWRESLRNMALLLAPTAPHFAEELWERLGGEYSVHQQPWPAWSEALAAEESIEIVIQVNGKVRDRISVPADATEEDVRAAVLASDRVAEALAGKTLRKFVSVPGRLANLVIG
ncbi:MAG: class I tRNA ligase family protein, partial [Armatimonadetes bacterium]|nr:class I tRNA ligase family protein [Armatimonadota bacterium]